MSAGVVGEDGLRGGVHLLDVVEVRRQGGRTVLSGDLDAKVAPTLRP